MVFSKAPPAHDRVVPKVAERAEPFSRAIEWAIESAIESAKFRGTHHDPELEATGILSFSSGSRGSPSSGPKRFRVRRRGRHALRHGNHY